MKREKKRKIKEIKTLRKMEEAERKIAWSELADECNRWNRVKIEQMKEGGRLSGVILLVLIVLRISAWDLGA